MKRPWLSTMIMLVIKWIFFYHWTMVWCVTLFQSLHQWISCSMGKSQIPLAKVTLSLTINHWISFAIASLMHDKMNTTSSQIKVLDQFHMNASCMVTLSCLKYSTKFERHCFSVNLHGRPLKAYKLLWLILHGWWYLTSQVSSTLGTWLKWVCQGSK